MFSVVNKIRAYEIMSKLLHFVLPTFYTHPNIFWNWGCSYFNGKIMKCSLFTKCEDLLTFFCIKKANASKVKQHIYTALMRTHTLHDGLHCREGIKTINEHTWNCVVNKNV